MRTLSAALADYADFASSPYCFWVIADAPDEESLAALRDLGYLVHVCRTVEDCCSKRTDTLMHAAQPVASGQYARMEAERGYPDADAPARLVVVLDRDAHQRAIETSEAYRYCFRLDRQYVDIFDPAAHLLAAPEASAPSKPDR
jgi:hypothetical protein